MAMKETVGSLKAYFIFISIIGFISDIRLISIASQNNLIVWIICSIGILFSVAYLYIGITLRKLLVESPQLINNMIYASMVYLVINFLLSLLAGFQANAIMQLVLGLLITWYLLKNVKRLSQMEKSRAK